MTTQIMTGNELIIQGGVEAGFSLYTGYPGSPLADYFNILNHKKRGISEKGHSGCNWQFESNVTAWLVVPNKPVGTLFWAMKSMGLHVASDALSVGNFAFPGTRRTQSQVKKNIPELSLSWGMTPGPYHFNTC